VVSGIDGAWHSEQDDLDCPYERMIPNCFYIMYAIILKNSTEANPFAGLAHSSLCIPNSILLHMKRNIYTPCDTPATMKNVPFCDPYSEIFPLDFCDSTRWISQYAS
jgi:hypothetical protein